MFTVIDRENVMFVPKLMKGTFIKGIVEDAASSSMISPGYLGLTGRIRTGFLTATLPPGASAPLPCQPPTEAFTDGTMATTTIVSGGR